MNFLIQVLFILFTITTTFSTVITFQWPESSIPKSDKYSVKVYQNGHEYPLFTHIVKTRTISGIDGIGANNLWLDRSNSFVQFDFDGEILVEVTKIYGEKASRVEISPKAFGINPIYFDGYTVKFIMKKPEFLSVNFICDDNKDPDGAGGFDIKNSMLIFANNIETEKPDTTKPGVVFYKPNVDISNANLIYFKAGYYNFNAFNDRHLHIKNDNVVIYVEGGAFIHGGIDFEGHDGIKLYGRGIFSMEPFAWHEPEMPMIDAMGCKNSYFEGLVFCASTHHTGPAPSDGSVIKNIKILGCSYNNDGIRPSNNCIVDHIFIKTTDDHDYARDNGIVTNSIFWPTRNGAVQQLGWNNLGKGGKRFKNNYIINAEWQAYHANGGVIGSQLKQGVNLSNDTLENIICENNTSMLVNLKIDFSSNNPWNPNNPGEIKDFVFKNIVLENDFRANNGKIVKQVIRGFTHNGVTAYVHDIRFINLVAGNTVITQDNYKKYFDIDENTTYNITFETIGRLYYIKTIIYGKGQVIEGDSIPVFENTNRTITIVPDEGYKIDSVIIDEQNLGRIQVYTFSNITSNHKVKVYFSKGDDYFNYEQLLTNFNYNLNVIIDPNTLPIIKYNLPYIFTTPIAFYIYNNNNSLVMNFYDNSVNIGENERVLNRINELTDNKYKLKLKIADLFVDSTIFQVNSNTSILNFKIKEINSDKLHVYPNPVKKKLYIQTQLKNVNISIIDQYGHIISSNVKNCFIFSPLIKPGTYYVILTKDNKIIAIKHFYKVK